MKVLVLFLFSMSTYAQFKCDVVKVIKKNKKTTSIKLCHNQRVDTVHSLDCQSKTCEIFNTLNNKEVTIENLDYDFEYGNPTVYICTHFGGIAERVELIVSGISHKIGWCRKGNSIVDLGSFFLKFKKKQKR